MRILLTGANGQLGRELRQALGSRGDVVCATRDGRLHDGTFCETADFDAPATLSALVRRIAPDVVVNAAAWTDVDGAETAREAAFRVNAHAPAELAEACAACGALLVHYSTDYVFDGRAMRPCREDDAPAPLSAYGESKLVGEHAVAASGARHVILRTAWLYSGHGKNFLTTILRLAKERDELHVVADQAGSPTPAVLVADITSRLLSCEPLASGTWHVAARGGTSRHGFASAIVAGAYARGLLARRPAMIPVGSDRFPAPARRPADSRLDTTRLREACGVHLPGWEEGLASVLDRLAAMAPAGLGSGPGLA
jgi:dTDP-4-dehydrorhamnose reductase